MTYWNDQLELMAEWITLYGLNTNGDYRLMFSCYDVESFLRATAYML